MNSLRETSDLLSSFPMETQTLEPYAGPQCFPHLRDAVRRNANAIKKPANGDEAICGLPELREQMSRCWLQCDDCLRWRLIERHSFPAVDPEGFSRRKLVPGWEPFDWGAWLARARDRYESYRHQHRQLQMAENPEEFDQGEQLADAPSGVPFVSTAVQGCLSQEMHRAIVFEDVEPRLARPCFFIV